MLSPITRHTLAAAFLHISRDATKAAQAGGLAAAIAAVQADDFQPATTRVRADVACVATQLAAAVADNPVLLKDLLSGTPVVSVTVGDAVAMDIAEDLIEGCFALTNDGVIRVMSVFTADGKPLTSYRNSILDALAAGQPVFGVRTPRGVLDPTLTAAVDHSIVLGPVDAEILNAVIMAVTGEMPTRKVADSVLLDLPISSLPVAIRSHWTAEQCLERLERPRTVAVADVPQGMTGPRVSDLVGYGRAKDWALQIVDDIAAWQVGKLLWRDCSSRLLVSGPPGVGKTLLARAVATSAGIELIETSVADWNAQKYLHGALAEIKRVFAAARKAAPCVLLLDEIDGLGDRRGLQGEHVQYWSQIINEVLVQLNDPTEGVIILGAANYPERIDAAVVRSGRLDQHIRIDLPGQVELANILRHHLGGELPDQDLTATSLLAIGGTGADVEAWIRQARVLARRAGRPLSIDHVNASIVAVDRPLSASERRRIAVHEAGHTLANWVLGVGTIEGVAINGRGGATLVELAARGSATVDDVEARLVVMLAGRAAEVAALGASCIGSGNGPTSDLARATELAIAIECQYGVGEFGAIYSPAEFDDVLRNPILFGVVRKRMAAAEKRADALIAQHRATLDALAEQLDHRGYLAAADILTITTPFEAEERKAS